MDEWNQNNPGGLVFVVQAQDVDSPQGKWIENMLSIDFENELSERYFLEDEQLQFFYVDMDEPYNQELSGENWPHRSTCNEPLQTDAQKQGEYCCWIIKAGCGFLNWNSCRFRIKDDCNNWTRSENLVPGEGFEVVITAPPDESEYEWGTPVFCHANVIGSPSYETLGDYIKWSVRPKGGENWYGPNDPGYSDWTEVIDSYISDTEWIGQNFYIDSFEDCMGLEIRARLDVCGFSLDDACTIYVPGGRSGQAWSNEGISLDIQQKAYVNLDNNKKVYWIDGPAIPWNAANDWYNGCLEDYRESRKPSLENFNIGKIRMRVCVSNPCIKRFTVEAILPDQTAQQILIALYDDFKDGTYCRSEPPNPSYITWDISGLECGDYKIRVKGFSHDGILLSTVESSVFYLDKVKKNDLVQISEKEIFHGITWGLNSGQLKCDQFVHQVLILLARKETGTNKWPLEFIVAPFWRPADPGFEKDGLRTKKIEFSEIEPGDLIVWACCHHVAIAAEKPTVKTEKDPSNNTVTVYDVMVWESTNHWGNVSLHKIKLGPSAVFKRGSKTSKHWHYAITWRIDRPYNIFKSCD